MSDDRPPTSTDPENSSDGASNTHEMIRNVKLTLDESGFRILDEFEDHYRSAGRLYHRSEKASRDPNHHSSGDFGILKQAFEISDEVEYNEFFAPLRKASSLLTKLQDSLRPGNRPQDHLVRIFSLMRQYRKQCDLIKDKIAATDKNLELLVSYDITQAGTPWTSEQVDLVDSSPHSMPWKQEEEWQVLRAWVWSLPETQRAVQTGRSVDEIAAEMLYKWEEPVCGAE